MSKPIVTRYAPSPTGFQHIGGIRTALFAYLWARKNNGTFILRIEDTDKARQVAGAIEHTQESLTWLGIDWDYGPGKPGPFGSCIQSERLDVYRSYIERLLEKGLAYPDPYTADEITAFRQQAEDEKRPFLYRNHRPDSFTSWDGKQTLRLKVPEIKRYQWQDAVRGSLEAGEEMLDDIVIMKADGFPTYNFAHVVDDIEMGVTHVMRGDEFISSIPKFLSIYDALGESHPVFVSLPPILNESGTKKLSKRDGAKDLLEYKTEGYLPTTMVNFLALIGWNPGTDQELFTKAELIEAFDITNIQKSGGAFNQQKLLWMNKEYYKQLPLDAFCVLVQEALPDETRELSDYSEARLERLLPSIRERVSNTAEIHAAAAAGEYDFAFTHPAINLELIAWKNDTSVKDALPRLQQVYALLETASFESVDSIKAAVWDYAEATGRGEVLWPLRTSLTGQQFSPDPFTVAYIIGREDTLHRLKSACDKIVAA